MEQEGILFILARMVRDPFLLSHGSETTRLFFFGEIAKSEIAKVTLYSPERSNDGFFQEVYFSRGRVK